MFQNENLLNVSGKPQIDSWTGWKGLLLYCSANLLGVLHLPPTDFNGIVAIIDIVPSKVLGQKRSPQFKYQGRDSALRGQGISHA
jgi:hypothetical protein